MCGRYWVDGELEANIRRTLKNFEGRINTENNIMYPKMEGSVITSSPDQTLNIKRKRWGFEHYDKSKTSVLFNARAETVGEKPMFRHSFLNYRCVVPVSGFYEWTKDKEKVAFSSKADGVLYLAAIYQVQLNTPQFTILTTSANKSVEPFHHRMPLIVNANQLKEWLTDEKVATQLLRYAGPPLNHRIEGQRSLFNI